MLLKDFLAEFDRRFSSLEDRVAKMDAKLKKVIDWTQRQDVALEREMQDATLVHFREHYHEYNAQTPHDFPKRLIDHVSGKEVTEFDGLVVLSKDVAYAGRGPLVPDSALVIIEAKQHLTLDKVKRKLAQLETLKVLIRQIKSGKDVSEVPKSVRRLQLQNVVRVALYIGGCEVDPAARKALDDAVKADVYGDIGLLEMTGARFKINDRATMYHMNGYDFRGSGRTRRKRRP